MFYGTCKPVDEANGGASGSSSDCSAVGSRPGAAGHSVLLLSLLLSLTLFMRGRQRSIA